MSEKIKVLHINSYYSYYGHAGFYKNFYEQQIKDGIDIDVYVPTAYEINNSKKEFGDYSRVVKAYNKFDRIIYHLKQHKMLVKAEELFQVPDYNLIHAHSLFANGYVAYHLNEKYDVPYIVAVRSTDINLFFKRMPLLRKYGIRILEGAKRIVFLSETYKNKTYKEYIPEKKCEELIKKTVVIPNGIDDFWLYNKYIDRKNSEMDKTINIIFVGNISRRKNPSTTVKACEILVEKGYSVKLTVVGPVEENDEYSKIIKSDLVEYVGKKSKEELIELYRKNDIFVMPSVTETFGLVYAEAMSQGLPLIYTRGQGFDGQFPEGRVGYNVNCHDAREIADKIIKIKKNFNVISSNCLELSNRFSWIEISKEYQNIYEQVYSEKTYSDHLKLKDVIK